MNSSARMHEAGQPQCMCILKNYSELLQTILGTMIISQPVGSFQRCFFLAETKPTFCIVYVTICMKTLNWILAVRAS